MTNLIKRELDLPASLAEVWRAISAPVRLSDWLADESVLELIPGGEASFRLGEEQRTGWVEEVSAPGTGQAGEPGTARLVFWWAHGDQPASRVELVLTPISDLQARLRVSEARPLEVLDLVGIPLPGHGGGRYGPALVAA